MGSATTRVVNFSNLIEQVAEYSCQVAVILMVLLVLAQVVFRYLLLVALSWAEEASIFLMIWMTFIGSGVALRRGLHIAVTILQERMSRSVSRYLFVISQVSILVFLVIVTWEGWFLMRSVEGQYSPALEVPMVWPYAMIPLGGAFMVSQVIATLLESSRSNGVDADVADLT